MNKLINLVKQLFSFGVVGIICFFVDFGLMFFMTHVFPIHYMASSTFSFIASNILNYCLSMRFVFLRKNHLKRETEFFIFFLMSLLGLVFNELFMFVFVEMFLLHYTLSKVIATLLVMVYNFLSRKIIFEKNRNGEDKNECTC